MFARAERDKKNKIALDLSRCRTNPNYLRFTKLSLLI